MTTKRWHENETLRLDFLQRLKTFLMVLRLDAWIPASKILIFCDQLFTAENQHWRWNGGSLQNGDGRWTSSHHWTFPSTNATGVIKNADTGMVLGIVDTNHTGHIGTTTYQPKWPIFSCLCCSIQQVMKKDYEVNFRKL